MLLVPGVDDLVATKTTADSGSAGQCM